MAGKKKNLLSAKKLQNKNQHVYAFLLKVKVEAKFILNSELLYNVTHYMYRKKKDRRA